jgi:hypothetical protein
MTLTEILEMGLDRVGLGSSTSGYQAAHKNRMRQYVVATAQSVFPMTNWWWLNKTTTFKTTLTFTVSGASGAFTVGETITGGTSSKTAVVDSHDNTNAPTLIYVYSESGTFTVTETLTGGTSGATATYASSANTRVYRPVSSNVAMWRSFANEDTDDPITILGADQYDLLDIDRSSTGTVDVAFVGGMDANTGYPEVELWRTPSTTNQTLRARYKIAATAWSSGNDATELVALGIPQVLEMGLMHGGAKLYFEQLRDFDGAKQESAELALVIELAKEQNLQMQGNRSYPAVDGGDAGLITLGSGVATAA